MNNIKKRLRSDLWIVLLDIIAVNGAYMLALLLRFYIHFKFTSGIGDFREYYLQFTPYYTVLCLIVFYVCGLYDGMWRYAGLDDMNRIILASVITAVIHVVGTKLFVHAMPTSYYLIGAFLQFFAIAAIRFAYRFLVIRKQRNERKKSWTIPAMVVGSGDCGQDFIQYVEANSPFQVVVVAGENSGKVMNGIPIVDYNSIPAQIQYHGIKAVFIADEGLDSQKRDEIEKAVEGVEVKDYTAFLSNLHEVVTSTALLPLVEGPVTVVIGGVEKKYNSANECLSLITGSYKVESVRGARIELRERTDVRDEGV